MRRPTACGSPRLEERDVVGRQIEDSRQLLDVFEGGFQAIRIMVCTDRDRERHRKPPAVGQVLPDLHVVGAENTGFGLMQREPFHRGLADHLPVSIRLRLGQDQGADILQEPKEEGVLAVVPADPFGQQLGRHGSRERILPELDVVERAGVLLAQRPHE